MNEFSTYHPIVGMVYFTLVIILSCTLDHPACIAISLISAIAYSLMLGGRKRLRFTLAFLLPLMLAAALINPAFNHRGVTILTYLPGGNPLTLESIIFGIAAAGVLVSVICHFYCMGEIMTSDKYIYLFGRLIPSLSLVLSMILRFIPKFRSRLRAVAAAQKCIGNDTASGNVIRRVKNGAGIFSAMMTWALESSVYTSDSMKSRGYGITRRTAFSNYRLDRRDKAALLYIISLGVYIITGSLSGALYHRYFPSYKPGVLTLYGASVMAAYLALCAMPIIIELWEEKKWRSLRQSL